MLAIGDCTLMVGDRLPATAQVAGQQGAYAAHLINRGFLPLEGGMEQVRLWKGCRGGVVQMVDTMGSKHLVLSCPHPPTHPPLPHTSACSRRPVSP